LIIALPPEIFGGVGTMTQILADHLRDQGHQVTIAFPATRSHRPELNAPLFFGQPSIRPETAFNGHNCVAVGTRLAELEFTYSKPSALWQSLIDDHSHHVVTGGTPVLATPLVSSGVSHLLWCASDVAGDRRERQKAYGLPRRLFDRLVVTPELQSQEVRVLRGGGQIKTISPYSTQCLKKQSGTPSSEVGLLAIPTDMDFFKPVDTKKSGWRLGFAGRLADPRKNAPLLLDVIAKLFQLHSDVSLTVTGEPTPELRAEVLRRGLTDIVNFVGILDQTELRDFYQDLDVFVIPSFQEGHAIVGVEAMACGVPVVSTRCGGPEAYIRDGENGYLSAFDINEMVGRIEEICGNPTRHTNMSKEARKSVVSEYGVAQFELNMKQIWRETFGSDL
jgi:glycosyltransferase involved in cell wall biosynthesis